MPFVKGLRNDLDIAQRLLSDLTPLSSDISSDLDAHIVQQHFDDLMKRLAVMAEVGAPGLGGRVLDDLMTGPTSYEEVIQQIDALLEFGRPFDQLTPAEQEHANRSEVRQEIRHFDRIMDLDHLRDGRVLKRRPSFVERSGTLGAMERLLSLSYERRVKNGTFAKVRREPAMTPQGRISQTADGYVMRRSLPPFVTAIAASAEPRQARHALLRFEQYLVKHPVLLALGLLDYELFIAKRTPVSLLAVEFSPDDNGAQVWCAGAGTCLVLVSDNFNYAARVERRFDSREIGSRITHYATLSAEARDAIVLLALQHLYLQGEPLELALNRRNKANRIYLNDNVARIASSAVTTVKAPRPTSTADEPYDIDVELERIAGLWTTGAESIAASIECGHVHSDREVGADQLRGLELGKTLVQAFERFARDRELGLSCEVTPMVDDDHVVNRLSYLEYLELFRERGVPVAELILESSPVIKAIAHDVLRRAIRNSGTSYTLYRLGDSLFLTDATGKLTVELIEDIDGEMRNGCVLFEIALVLYRSARQGVARLFEETLQVTPAELHMAAAQQYDSLREPSDREQYRARWSTVWAEDYAQIAASTDQTVYVDTILRILENAKAKGEARMVINVLEDYYRPQQEKVKAVADLIGIELPLHAIFFNTHNDHLACF